MLAVSRVMHFGQAPAPIEERRLIRKMLTELNALPAEFANLDLVNALLVGDDVAVPTHEGSLLLWPSDDHTTYAIAWGQVVGFINFDQEFPLETMTVVEAQGATATVLAALDQKLGIAPMPTSTPTSTSTTALPATPSVTPEAVVPVVLTPSIAPRAAVPAPAKTRVPRTFLIVGGVVGAALLIGIGIVAAATRSRERSREQLQPTGAT